MTDEEIADAAAQPHPTAGDVAISLQIATTIVVGRSSVVRMLSTVV
jgi:hypothetical protein